MDPLLIFKGTSLWEPFFIYTDAQNLYSIHTGPSHWNLDNGNSMHDPLYSLLLIMGTLFIHPTPKTYTVYRDPLSGTHITGNSVHGPSHYAMGTHLTLMHLHPTPIPIPAGTLFNWYPYNGNSVRMAPLRI